MPKQRRSSPKIKLSKETSRDRARRSHLAGQLRSLRRMGVLKPSDHRYARKSEYRSLHKSGKGRGTADHHVEAGVKFPKGHRLKKASFSKVKIKKGFEKKTLQGSANRAKLAWKVGRTRAATGASPTKKAYRKMGSSVKKEGQKYPAQKPKKKRAIHPIMKARQAGFRYPL